MTALDDRPEASPFLTGIYAPVYDELDAHDLPVTGKIPAQLSGVYMRNGANPQFAPLGRYHWFDGDGMIHAVYLDGGRARYKNRWVETPGLRHERSANSALFGGILNFQFPPAELMEECGIFKNAANTNIVAHANKYLALWEGGFPSEIDRELDSKGLWDFDGKLVGAMTAHPKWCPQTGEMMFFGYDPVAGPPFLRYHVADSMGALTHTAEIELPRGVMMHDFLTTRNYSLFFDLPAVVAASMTGGQMWQPEHGARIGVIPRHGAGSDARWFEIDPCYVFHFLNAFEVVGSGAAGAETIVAYGCRMPGIDLDFEAREDDIGGLAAVDGIGLTKWTIDLATGTCTEERVHDLRSDFPRLHDDLLGLPHRWGYASATLDGPMTIGFNGIIRYDLESGAELTYAFGEGISIGEAVFAADAEGSGEQDGWLMVYATDMASGNTDFCIIDARDMAAGPVARIHLPQRVPSGFHGNWMPS
jgi:carotenoid cleavage dioxygenase-like enzyme